jgi:hypothetical protein
MLDNDALKTKQPEYGCVEITRQWIGTWGARLNGKPKF